MTASSHTNPVSAGGYLTPAEAAAMLYTDVKTLEAMRDLPGLTLPFIRIGDAVYYRRDDVVSLTVAWLQCKVAELAFMREG